MSSLSESAQASLLKFEQTNGVASLPERINQLSQRVLEKETLLLGKHSEFQKTLKLVEQFVHSEEPVLITGESGVGKELFARALYLLNGRQSSPFVIVNCGQFSDEHLMVSELFGHRKGSFTGAVEEHRGVFESADGGVIFLDEIGELSASAQKMLLRVIDQKEIRAVGSNKIRHVDIRVISATHRNLSHLVEEGKFREDLFFRLSCLHLHVSALRERGEDRLLLLQHYLNELNRKHGVLKSFSDEALTFLRTYSFPGNVRELKNILETGFRVSASHLIRMEDVTTKLHQRRKGDLLSFDMAEYYSRMVDCGECFWEVVREPFLQHDLSRAQVQAIVQKGMQAAGNYKRLTELFNLPGEDYKSFLDFLYTHGLRAERKNGAPANTNAFRDGTNHS